MCSEMDFKKNCPLLCVHDLKWFIEFIFNQVLQMQSSQSSQNKAVPSAALLFVLVERAHALPVS